MARSRLLIFGVLLFTTLCAARSHSRKRSARTDASFDYYLLSLSWAPDFCATAAGNRDPLECSPGRRLGFVVHGLWPQSNSGRGPEKCGSVSPVSSSIVNLVLNYMPGTSLIQHEWQTHGSCTGLSADDYFALVRKARDKVKIPSNLTAPTQTLSESAAQIESEFARANPTFPAAAFRATCTNGALQEARICMDKNLTPQQCTPSAGECADAAMQILPPR